MERGIIYFASAFFVGLIVFCSFGIYVAALLMIAAVLLSLILFFFRKRNSRIHIFIIVCIAVVSASVLFVFRTAFYYVPACSAANEKGGVVEGELTQYGQSGDRYYYTIKNACIDGTDIPSKVRISSNVYRDVAVGDKLCVNASRIYVLGLSTDMEHIYKADGIYIGAYTFEYFDVKSPEKPPIGYYIDSVRRYISEKLYFGMGSECASVADGILTGNRSGMSDEIYSDFKASGMIHLFAVSGFHLSLWSTILSASLSKILSGRRRLCAVVVIIFVVFFMALAGFSKSVVRAGVMMIIMQCAPLFDYSSDSLNSLFFALAVILVINPFAAMSLALQLSFSATLGIIIFSHFVNERIATMRQKVKSRIVFRVASAFYSAFAVSVAAALFTIPVSVVTLGYYSSVSPITNILIFIPAEITMFLSGLGVIFYPISVLSKPMFIVCRILIKYMLFVTDKTAELPFASVTVESSVFRLTAVLILAVIVALCICFAGKTDKLRFLFYAASAGLVVMSAIAAGLNYLSLHI